MNRLLKHCWSLGLLGVMLVAVGCRDNSRPPLEYMPDMIDSPAIEAQEQGRREMVPGTRYRGFAPYPYTVTEGDKAGVELKNPLPMTLAVMQKGQTVFNNYCAVCHGTNGKGQGSIVPKFPMPPSLHSEKVVNWSDGRIFHVISRGQNLMPAYINQVFPEERWAVIHYIRALQRSVNPLPADVEGYKAELLKK